MANSPVIKIETAIKLKNIGFDYYKVLGFYLYEQINSKNKYHNTVDYYDRPFYDGEKSIDEHFSDWNDSDDRISAPTLDQCKNWFLTKKEILIEPLFDIDNNNFNLNIYYKGKCNYYNIGDTYYKVLEKGIDKACDILVF